MLRFCEILKHSIVEKDKKIKSLRNFLFFFGSLQRRGLRNFLRLICKFKENIKKNHKRKFKVLRRKYINENSKTKGRLRVWIFLNLAN